MVTWALNWGVIHGEFRCKVSHGRGMDFAVCPNKAVIFHLTGDEQLCEEHMGYHRWVTDDTVFQWKADPVWIYAKPLENRKRGKNVKSSSG